ncbi:MAG: ATP-binding protein [Candidatus Omnitrophota bacterium]|nr:ATP-binding protein [Candidatus Omnitrophota bacterium]
MTPAQQKDSPIKKGRKDEIKIKEWLTPIVVGAYPDETVLTVTKRMHQYGIGAVIVYSTEQEPVGIFTERDVMNKIIAEERDPEKTTIKEVMTSPVETIPVGTHPMEIFKLFSERNFRHLPVALDDGRIIGVLSLRSRGFLQEVIRIMSILESVNEMKSHFLSNVSHELRSPLISMTKGASLALDHSDDLDKLEVTKILKMVESQGGRLLEIINDLLDMTALEAGKVRIEPKDIDIIDLIHESIRNNEVMSKRKLISIAFENKAASTQVYVDEGRIKQVLDNLLSNAVKFTPESGRITIVVNSEEQNRLKVSVRDTGVGIPKDKISLIFERFEQAHDTNLGKPQGTGLGLSIVKEIVTLHNGSVWVESEEDKGATFFFTVPTSPAINF